MNEMTNDAAVARDFYERLYGMSFRLFLDANGEPDDDNGIELRLAATVGEKALFETADHSVLFPATTVAELRARVSELEGLLSDTAGNLRRMANDEFADCEQVRLEHVVNRIEHKLARTSP